MGGRSGQQQTSTSTTFLPTEQQENVDMLLQGARDFYRTGGPQYYTGQTYANTDPNTLAGRTGSLGYAGGIGGALTQDLIQGDRFFLDTNNIFDPTRIPGYARARE